MKKAAHNYSLIFRLAWLTMALSMVVLCGPVKKLIQLRSDKSATSHAAFDKKLHTGYRDRRDTAPSINIIGFHSVPADDGIVLFFSAAVLAAFIIVGWQASNNTGASPVAATLQAAPRFISFRQLRI